MNKWLPIGIIVLILTFALGCKKDDEYLTDPGAQVAFSTDTVIFDTVFTTVGSSFRTLKVYNNNDQPILLSNVALENGSSSNFRLNVDGDPGLEFTDVEIAGEDSLFIFVEVTVDPNNGTTPMIIEEKLNFTLNGSNQHVLLVAWGQDACFIYPNQSIAGLPSFSCLGGDCDSLTTVTETWTDEKPYVIYGYLIVDEGDHLIIEAGTQVHFHTGSGLWVWEGGQLNVNGECGNRVVFQGDRLDYEYIDIPGQWDLIRINEGSEDNVINYATIKNSIIGIQATPLTITEDQAENPITASNKLILNSVIIQDNSTFGLQARNYGVQAINCLFANAGVHCGLIQGAGSYDFNQCTFANYWTETPRSTPGFFISNIYQNEVGTIIGRNMGNSSFRNCIMYGNDFEEFSYFFDEDGITADAFFENNLYKLMDTQVSSSVYFGSQQFVNLNPDFVNVSSRDFHIPIGSPAQNAAIGAESEDLDCNARIFPPDLGCYEAME